MRKRTGHIGMSEEARQARMKSIGGSDARIIMSGDQNAIEQLWREKRGEQEPENLDDVLLIALGNITESLNADWFEQETLLTVTDEQLKEHLAEWPEAHSTLDGKVRNSEGKVLGVVEFKYMLPFGFSKEAALEKYFPQIQHNMMVTNTSHSWLSIITGAGQYVLMEVDADVFYQIKLLEAERDFWDAVQTGRTPGVPDVQIPNIERVKIVDMSSNNEWGVFSSILLENETPSKTFEKAKKDIKKLMPKDAKVAAGNGVTINLSSDGKMLIKLDKEEVAKADKAAGRLVAANDDKPAKATKPRTTKAKAKPAEATADAA